MYSIFCVFGCFSSILAKAMPPYNNNDSSSIVFPVDSQEVIRTPPFYYGYHLEDFTNVRVNFTNLSPDVVYKVYESGTSEFPKKTLNSSAGSDVYTIAKKVEDEQILIYVELITKAADSCKNITIIEGRALPRYRLRNVKVVPRYEHNDVCLRSFPPCTIAMDLMNECTGTPPVSAKPQTSAKPSTQATSAKRDTDPGILSNNTFKPNVTSLPQNVNIQNTTAKDNITDVSTPDPFKSQEFHDKNETTTNNEQQQSSPNVLLYVIPSMIGMSIIILVIYISIKKYCHQNSHAVEPMELNTYATANQVIYAELSLVHGDSQPSRCDQESPYAEIIGVMKPVDEKNVRKNKT